jgi:hypothetical protein
MHTQCDVHVYTVFPNSAAVYGQVYRIATLFDIRIMEKSKRTDEQVVRGSMLRNFWQTFYGKLNSIRLSLVSAVVKASLLLRCGDVETNPGPEGKISCWYMYRGNTVLPHRPYLHFSIMNGTKPRLSDHVQNHNAMTTCTLNVQAPSDEFCACTCIDTCKFLHFDSCIP